MSKMGSFGSGGGGGSGILTVTGNTGGAVPGDISQNINLVGAGSVTVSGNAGTNTLTITTSTSESTTYVSSSPYTVLTTDDVLLMDTATYASPMTVLLPDSPAVDGQQWTIKDWSGQATSFNVTVTTVSGSTLIDGATSFVIANNYESVTVVWSLSQSTYSIVSEVLPSVIDLPYTTSTTGYVAIDGSSVLQAIGGSNIFAGIGAGNFTTTGSNNSGFGLGVLSALGTGNNNTAVGSGALANSTNDNNSTAVGYGALGALNGASNNTAVGYGALGTSQTDSGNTAVGYWALLNVNGGGNNTALGTSTLSQSQSGANNVALGYAALATSQFDSNNTAVGSQALTALNGGSANVALGASALITSVSDSNNTAIGYGSLTSCNGGSYNTAVGTYSLGALQNGQVNVALGYASLPSLTTGSSNAVVGENGFEQLVSGSYNLGMGQFTGANYTSSESNNIVFNHGGVTGENNTLRIGSGSGSGPQQLSAAYISGIDGVNLNTANVVVEASDQLGTAVLTPGAGISISTSTNEIIIGCTVSGATSTTYVNSTPYTVLTTDQNILVDTATIAAASNIILPDSPAVDGQVWTIKDWSGQSATYPVTINTVSSLSIIDGSTTFILANAYESVSVVWSLSESTYSIVSEVEPAVISLPTTTATTGFVEIGGTPVLQAFGNQCIFVGANAGTLTFDPTVCPNNTVVGYGAMSVMATVEDNVAIGAYALQNCTNAQYNVAIGSQAMNQATSGIYNVVIGFQTGYELNGANGVTAIGTYALSASNSDQYNTVVGYNALGELNGGGHNASFGDNSGQNLASGEYNIFFGSNAGGNYNAAESSNISIGNAGTPGENNTLRIGNNTGSGPQELSAAYISGIDGVNLNSLNVVVEVSDQLGTAVLTPGAGISITTGVNTITIASTSSSTPSTTYVNSSPYTVLATDYVIMIDTVSIGAASTVLLPEAPSYDGEEWTIKDITGAAATYPITVQSVLGDINIDLSTTFVMNTNLQSVTVVWSASQGQYYII